MYGITSTIFRFGNVYGPYSFHKKGVINKLFNCFENNVPFQIYGDGSSTRDYIYSCDIAETIVQTLVSPQLSLLETFHLSTAKQTSLLQLYEIFASCYKFRVPIEFNPVRVGEVDKNCASYSKANNF